MTDKLLILTLVLCFAIKADSQTDLNTYKYAVIPMQYDFLQGKDVYRLNTLTKHLFKQQGFDAVISDVNMPVMDGIDAIKSLRADRSFASIPILALTSRAMIGDQDRCIEAGADEYLSKPVHLKQLVKIILSRLSGAKPR